MTVRLLSPRKNIFGYDGNTSLTRGKSFLVMREVFMRRVGTVGIKRSQIVKPFYSFLV